MAEAIAKTKENVAQKNANEEKNPVFFFKYACWVANRSEAAHNGSRKQSIA